MQLEIVNGDLLDQDVDVIVNAWNRNIIPWWLLLPQGVSGAIKKRGGYGPFRELAKLGPIPLGGCCRHQHVVAFIGTVHSRFGSQCDIACRRTQLSVDRDAADRRGDRWRFI